MEELDAAMPIIKETDQYARMDSKIRINEWY